MGNRACNEEMVGMKDGGSGCNYDWFDVYYTGFNMGGYTLFRKYKS